MEVCTELVLRILSGLDKGNSWCELRREYSVGRLEAEKLW